MLIEQAIYQILVADAGVAALVNSRIFAGVLPQVVTYPAVAYRPPPAGFRGNRRVIRTLEGGCTLVSQRIHVFSAAKGQREFGPASELDAAIFAALDEYRGTVIDSTVSPAESLNIQAIFATNIAHVYGYDDKLQVHNFITEFEIHYTDPNRL